MSQPDTRVLQAEAGPDALVDIETALERVWSIHPHVPPIVRMHMGIAAGEIGANILEHAAPGRTIRITMDVAVCTAHVQVEFTDTGEPVQVDIAAISMPDDMAERGRGLALARSVLAELAYRRSDVNHWSLVSNPFG